jgi:HK97 family phage portal protein
MFSLLKKIWNNVISGPKTLAELGREIHEANDGFTEVSKNTPERALRSATVMACVNLISDNIAQLPLHLYKKEGEERVEAVDHPLYSILRYHPNSWQTPFEFFQFLVMSMLLTGMGCALVRRIGKTVVSLIPIPSSSITEVWNGDLHYFSITMQDGSYYPADPGEVLCVKAFSLDGRHASSPIEYAAGSINLSMRAERHSTNLLRNGATPSGIISTPNALDQQTINDLKANWQLNHSGENIGKVGFLWGGMEYKPVTISNADAQLLEIMNFKRSDIAAIFRCPPNMVGLADTGWGTGIAEHKQSFLTFTLSTHLVKICQAIHKVCLSSLEQKKYYCEFNTDAFLMANILDRSRAYREALGGTQSPGWITVNEVRKSDNRPPINDPRCDQICFPVAKNGENGFDTVKVEGE